MEVVPSFPFVCLILISTPYHFISVVLSSLPRTVRPSFNPGGGSMALEHDRYDWHLTPRGWQPGDPPSDRVESWLGTQFSHDQEPLPTLVWSMVWESPQHSERERDALRMKLRRPVPEFDNPRQVLWSFPYFLTRSTTTRR